MVKVDFHTHSVRSRDGAITAEQYTELIENGTLDYIAVTDHNHVSFARELHARLGDRIIIAEEVNALEGEIIGLFLTEKVPRDLSAKVTIKHIKDQGGLVYIPHPFETIRRGLPAEVLLSVIDDVDIIEVFNGRAFFQNKGAEAMKIARLHNKATAASSDAHGIKGMGTVYTSIASPPTAKNLVSQLQTAKLSTVRPPLKTLLYPKINRLRKGWVRD